MKLSIIIPVYQVEEYIERCLKSIISQDCKDYEIILVDNASVDGSAELFSKDERIVFIGSNENLGFGKANNLGFSRAKGKYIFLLNSDTILVNDAIAIFFEKMKLAGEDVACLGTYLYDCNMKGVER